MPPLAPDTLQRLPLPVGSPHPVRRPAGAAWPRARWARTLTALAGVLAAAGGAALAAAPPVVSVGVDGQAYRVGDASLPALGGGVYAGPEGAVVVRRTPDGVLAAASTTMRGVHVVGSCREPPDAQSERCRFDVGGRTVTAVDRLRGGGWDRRYGDGRTVRIDLDAGRPVPVPLPIGR